MAYDANLENVYTLIEKAENDGVWSFEGGIAVTR